MKKQTVAKKGARFVVDGNSYPSSLSSSVIFRVLKESPKDMAEFYEDYRNSCMSGGRGRVASQLDLKIFADYRKNLLLISELAKKYGLSYARVNSAIVRASRVA